MPRNRSGPNGGSTIKPFYHEIMARLDAYGLERILLRIENCDSHATIAADPEIRCGRSTLTRWLLGYYGSRGETKEDRRARAVAYYGARQRMAIHEVEDAKTIADEEQDWRMSGVIRERVKIRTWHAERLNRALFGAQPQEVHVHIGQLHLNALRHREVQTLEDEVLDVTTSMEVSDAIIEGEIAEDDQQEYQEVETRRLPAETSNSHRTLGGEAERREDPHSTEEAETRKRSRADGVA